MKESDREYVFTSLSRLCQSLISEAEVLCELIDDDGDFDSVVRHISSLEDEADNIIHEIQYYYQENRLFRDPDCMMIYDIGMAVEACTDLIYDIAKTFIRLNIYEVKDNMVYVTIGDVIHPMMENHYIEWIILETEKGIQKKDLTPTDEPKAIFPLLEGDKVLAVYEYCNLHGLWKR